MVVNMGDLSLLVEENNSDACSYNNSEECISDTPVRHRRRRINSSKTLTLYPKSESGNVTEPQLIDHKTDDQESKSQCDEKQEVLVNNNDDSSNEYSKKVFNISELKSSDINDLAKKAEDMCIQNSQKMSKQELILNITRKVSSSKGSILGCGVMEILQDGFGFLRTPESNYTTSIDNVYVSSGQIKKFGIRTGDTVLGEIRPPNEREKYFTLVKVLKIGSSQIDKIKSNRRVNFDELTPLYPDEMIKLECEEDLPDRKRDVSMRAIDILAPLGKGQRALIVAPPKTGKTMLLQNIARSITLNHPTMKLIVLLIDERPEEVTDMMRSVNAEVISSTFDEPAYRHVQLSEIVSEMAKRLVEEGRDVVILLDSITRLARAYNVVVPSSGKVLTGGIDSNALQRPKRFFGAARNIEGGGSLTIIATALVETGSRMDEVIFEEFKGTGNSEIVLDRKLAEKRNFPAIDVTRSGTRKEELLLPKDVLAKSWVLRRVLAQMGTIEGMEFLRDKLIMTKNNSDFFETMNS